jgi:hypothetical protein
LQTEKRASNEARAEKVPRFVVREKRKEKRKINYLAISSNATSVFLRCLMKKGVAELLQGIRWLTYGRREDWRPGTLAPAPSHPATNSVYLHHAILIYSSWIASLAGTRYVLTSFVPLTAVES